MRYIDTGSRDAGHALGTWLLDAVRSDSTRIGWQTGFFGIGAFQNLEKQLADAASNGCEISGVLGSNDGQTLASDILDLLAWLRIPQSAARLGVVSYSNAFFHPKTVYVQRSDGSQTAYVGSANLTTSGVVSKHVEAGLILDTRDGDDAGLVLEVWSAIASWFSASRAGFYLVNSASDVDQLCGSGVLALRRQQLVRVASESKTTSPRQPRSGLSPLIPIRTDRHRSFTSESPVKIRPGSTVHGDGESWSKMWRSRPLSHRDLGIPRATGGTTNPTGSMLLKAGAWMADANADFRHYFFEQVFSELAWSVGRQPHLREAFGLFRLDVEGERSEEHVLRISHNTDTNSTTYIQRNGMTHLSWGAARHLVCKTENLDRVLTLHRSVEDARRFRISIAAA